MGRLLAWLDDKNWREKVAFVAAGLAAIATAAWTVFAFVAKDGSSETKRSFTVPPVIQTPKAAPEPTASGRKYLVCRAWTNHNCPANADFIGCELMIPQWAREQCGSSYVEKTVSSVSAQQDPMTLCGIHVSEITCMSK
jgi:hypothetical protein